MDKNNGHTLCLSSQTRKEPRFIRDPLPLGVFRQPFPRVSRPKGRAAESSTFTHCRTPAVHVEGQVRTRIRQMPVPRALGRAGDGGDGRIQDPQVVRSVEPGGLLVAGHRVYRGD